MLLFLVKVHRVPLTLPPMVIGKVSVIFSAQDVSLTDKVLQLHVM